MRWAVLTILRGSPSKKVNKRGQANRATRLDRWWMPGGPDFIRGSLAFHGYIFYHGCQHHDVCRHCSPPTVHTLCLTPLYRLLSSLTTGKGTDPPFTVVLGPCLVFTDEKDDRNSLRGPFFFPLPKKVLGWCYSPCFYSNWIGQEISISQRLVLSPFGLWTNRQILGVDGADPEDQGKVPNEDRG